MLQQHAVHTNMALGRMQRQHSLGQRSELDLVAVAQRDHHVAPEAQPPSHSLHILDLLIRRIQRFGCADIHVSITAFQNDTSQPALTMS